jgi:DNA-binding transcriptional ArsR family regulator
VRYGNGVVTDPGRHAAALDALGDPNRRAILELLAGGPASVRSLADRLPISRPAVSRHLRLLRAADLVGADAVGAQRVYRLEPGGAEAVRAYFEQLWGDAVPRFRLAAENRRPRT